MSESPTQVFVAEDHPLYRAAIISSIESCADLELVGHAEEGVGAAEQIRALDPDVALIDIKLPGLDGVGVVRAIGGNQARTKTVLISAYAQGDLIMEAFEAGAAGYLSKEAGGDEVCEAIVAAGAGQRVLSPGLEHRLTEAISRRNDEKFGLSFRETEVIELMAEGHSNKKVASLLSISEHSVRTHVSDIFEKLEVSTRSAAVAEAMRRGVLS